MNNIERAIDTCKQLSKRVPEHCADDLSITAVKALEKQIPKKIYNHSWNGIDGVPYDLCPSCKTNLCTTGVFANRKDGYCAHCGQKLDWEAEKII